MFIILNKRVASSHYHIRNIHKLHETYFKVVEIISYLCGNIFYVMSRQRSLRTSLILAKASPSCINFYAYEYSHKRLSLSRWGLMRLSLHSIMNHSALSGLPFSFVFLPFFRNSAVLFPTRSVCGETAVTMYGIARRGRMGPERIEECGTIRVLHFLCRAA